MKTVCGWKLRAVLGAILFSCAAPFICAATQPADTILLHARIYTVNSRQPWAQALAIRGEHIVFVGKENDKALARLRGPHTEVIDAGGRMVLPGFVDSHIHFLDGSLSLTRVNLEGANNVAEMQERLKKFADTHPAGSPREQWILGRGWSYPAFGAVALPDKRFIDEVIPDRPVFLEGFDGHTYWANSKALQLAGINRETPDPPNGKIVRDASGEPTGALKETAEELIEKVAPKPTREEKIEAVRRGLAEANRAGLVRVHSCGGDFDSLDLFDELRRNHELTVRMYIAYFLDPPALTAASLAKIESARKQYHDDWISGGAVKTMLDGVVETHTAAMIDPYSDDPSTRGKMFWEAEKYKQAIRELDARGLQIFTHAIGEAAVRLALDAYEQAQEAQQGNRRAHSQSSYPVADPRHRIEHIETVTAADIPRFGKLGVIASFQPLHAYPDKDTLEVWLRNAGPERGRRAFAWQAVARTGGRLAFGSDWPVVTLNPWQGIQTAVTRQTEEGTPPGGWLPAERISLAQAIEGYTLGAAVGGRRERFEGSLETGKLADLIVLSQNLFNIEPHRIAKTEVLLTMVGGKAVYRSPNFKASDYKASDSKASDSKERAGATQAPPMHEAQFTR